MIPLVGDEWTLPPEMMLSGAVSTAHNPTSKVHVDTNSSNGK